MTMALNNQRRVLSILSKIHLFNFFIVLQGQKILSNSTGS